MLTNLTEAQCLAIRRVLERIEYLENPYTSAENATIYDEKALRAMTHFTDDIKLFLNKGLFHNVPKLFENIDINIRKALAREYFLDKQIEEMINAAFEDNDSDDSDATEHFFDATGDLSANVAISHFRAIEHLLSLEGYEYHAEEPDGYIEEFKEHSAEIKQAII